MALYEGKEMQCMNQSMQKMVSKTDTQKAVESAAREQTERVKRTGRTREKDRYRLEEDENSIYEYDTGCLNEKRRR